MTGSTSTNDEKSLGKSKATLRLWTSETEIRGSLGGIQTTHDVHPPKECPTTTSFRVRYPRSSLTLVTDAGKRGSRVGSTVASTSSGR